jgi:hypothetical protein
MISEAPFFFSVTAVNVTLAGFSGLVAAFRRGEQLRSAEVFHLRGIAETGLANALIAWMTIPVATIRGDLRTAIRILSLVVLAYVGVQIAVFARRQRRMSVPVPVPQAVGAIGIDVAVIARPMWDFVQVLRTSTGADVPSRTNDGK